MGRIAPPRASDQTGIQLLRRRDKRLRAIMDRAGPFRVRIVADPFAALVSSILHQQLSMKAAATISGRVLDLCDGRRFTPQALGSLSKTQLRAAGLSNQKCAYVAELCEQFGDGRLSSARLRKLDDEAVIEAVTAVKGIGRWTAEMLLIFCLRRPDVWPIDDLGIRKACQKLLGAAKEPPRDELVALGESWRPHRTIASWYLWRSVEFKEIA
ncbi:MAG: DNA-3-methyladenine glycosylase family protein [Phycisphaerae bacterium]